MNFLAHFHLAWPEATLLAGALEGDYYKGLLAPDLAPGLARGIRLHRAIDAYTDQHPAVEELRRQFPGPLRRYAGIVIDIGFDHFLSRRWSDYAALPLDRFNRQVMASLGAQRACLSAPAQRMLQRMDSYRILERYHDWDAVPASAARVGERLRRGNPLASVAGEAALLRPAMGDAFDAFYPDLVNFCQRWRAQT